MSALQAMKHALEALEDAAWDDVRYCMNPAAVEAASALRTAIAEMAALVRDATSWRNLDNKMMTPEEAKK